jgi:hypothetical protein
MTFEKISDTKLKVTVIKTGKKLTLTNMTWDDRNLEIIEFIAKLKCKGDKSKVKEILNRYKKLLEEQ